MSNIPTGMNTGTGMYYNKVQAQMQQYLNGGNRNRSRNAPRGSRPASGSMNSAQLGQNAGVFARRFVHNFFSRS